MGDLIHQNMQLGHVHSREEVSQEHWIVFPGNIQGRHIRETGAKGCTMVTVDDGDVVSVEHQSLDVLRWSVCELDVTDIETVDEIYELISDELQETLDNAEGRPVAIRLVIKGACPAHTKLHVDREHWIQEYRALATGLGGEGIWLEKISIKTRPSVSNEEILDRDDGLTHLLRSIQDMELNDNYLDKLAVELSMLRQKLPPEILGGEDPYDPANPELIKDSLEDIKEYLVNHLLSTEQG